MGGSHDKSFIDEGSAAPEFSAFRPIEINGLRYFLGTKEIVVKYVIRDSINHCIITVIQGQAPG